MRINTVPVEAYRQTNNLATRKNEAGDKSSVNTRNASDLKTVTLPGNNQVEVSTLKAQRSPSLLQGVLSAEEKDMLSMYFARFGDSAGSSGIYDPNAQPGALAITGSKVDLKG